MIVGRDNLAANGHEIPELAYAVASGEAIGDWTLGCVAGDVTSMTFVFADGRIVTVPEARDVSDGGAGTRPVRLGGLSDDHGNPCVAGERVTNAAAHLGQSAAVLTLGAAAEGLAAAQTMTVAGGAGGTQTVVDGDLGRYVAGHGLAGAAREVARWLRERQAQSYDAVYVPPGARVAVHVDEALRIDYDPAGRLVRHEGRGAGGEGIVRWTRTIAAVGVAAALAGCATTEPAAVLAGGPRMIELYRGTAAEPSPEARGAPEALQAPEGTVPEAPEAAVVEATCRWGWFRWPCEAPAPPPAAAACACGDAPAYTRTAANELDLLFPRLPNPDVYIYVPPHLATELRIPVPGYTTAVPLYYRVEYALPGEGGAARGPSEARPGASPEEAPSGASPEEAPPGANPEDTRRGVSPEKAGSGARAEEGQLGASPEEARPGASPEEVRAGVSPEEARPDANPEEAPPGARAEEAQLEASPEEARSGANAEEAP